MINRYDSAEISYIWSDEFKFKTFLRVELALLRALESNQIIPPNIANEVEKKAQINPARIDELELQTKHDVIAFCSSITEQLPASVGKFFHYGVTSSDIIDTSLSLQMRASLELIESKLVKVLSTLKHRALESKNIISIGRSHGMHAEPLSFGQKLLGHYCEFKRRHDDLITFMQTELTAQFSGAVGNYTILTPEVELQAAAALGLTVEELSTQIIPRDHIAKAVSIGAMIAAAIERLAVEIRHLSRSEVQDVAEGFSKKQKGSSTMPHKKNPISSENISGLARVIKSHQAIALENIVLWHERDISHSSAERLYLPDHFGLLYYALGRLDDMLTNLTINKEKIESKIAIDFSYLSSYFLHLIITECEITREAAYEIIQKSSFELSPQEKSENNLKQFIDKLENNLALAKVKYKLPSLDLEKIRSIYTKQIDKVFNRVLS
ncbi:MAG: adenylosuccinate lyase [Bdellovibrionales bacterium RIFOXYD12_FULL_39_22]|nr:MAG: adenylosuccinate lyase [Bdellovibrionales bacterium RIFOXYB1_FULL_39_21]OFZ43964.1 MAG: adenylosuccinate lyase [Bdellovibrionales bacterium RIFOXYC12_FULL_39_17]OFZ48336.1 MAG: adenylosuccinate lyase [Bdellovibrionales bacterium RIFOXYC1_FULL_39_130]OFZ76641.1 MAG: adenylosuccinate lyase [Bdellovibrionales bacterium RIFOXYD1_FULL_39_84]OFZ94927.1 MAG: adenylosuccinate lyase [Bdellovibrionales bacterium RIFOXYD12_FULL_39_22]HLE12651.1 adenylosuccinate lyase [Bacteriovoracaceae bacterium